MSLPLFVMTKVATPALDVHAPVMDKAGGCAAGTHRLMSAWAVRLLSFGLERV